MADKAEMAEAKPDAKESIKVKRNHLEHLQKAVSWVFHPEWTLQLTNFPFSLTIFQDAKKDNDSKNEETKNGEKEEDDESSDEEEHAGSFSSIAELRLALFFSLNVMYALLAVSVT